MSGVHKEEQKVFKCSAKAATKRPFSILNLSVHAYYVMNYFPFAVHAGGLSKKTFLCLKIVNRRAYDVPIQHLTVIGSNSWSNQLMDALVEYHENNNLSKIEVHKATSVKSALSSLPNIYADFVIILLDVRKNDCIVEAEINLLALEPSLLCGRTIFVNPRNNVKQENMGISYKNIACLKRTYKLHIMHGNIEDYLSRMFLARRIMAFFYKVNQGGLPNIFEFFMVD